MRLLARGMESDRITCDWRSVARRSARAPSVALRTPSGCRVARGRSRSTGCIPFVSQLEIAGTFDTSSSVSGSFTMRYKPDQFASCCVLSNIDWSAALP